MRQGLFPPFGFVLAEFGLWELGLAPFLAFFDFWKIRSGDTLKIIIPRCSGQVAKCEITMDLQAAGTCAQCEITVEIRSPARSRSAKRGAKIAKVKSMRNREMRKV